MKKILSFLFLGIAILFLSSCASQRCDCPKVEKPGQNKNHSTATAHNS